MDRLWLVGVGGVAGGPAGQRPGTMEWRLHGVLPGPRTCCVYRPGFGSDLALSRSKSIHRGLFVGTLRGGDGLEAWGPHSGWAGLVRLH